MCSSRALPTCSVPGRHVTARPCSPWLPRPSRFAGTHACSLPATSFLISAARPGERQRERGRGEREKSPRGKDQEPQRRRGRGAGTQGEEPRAREPGPHTAEGAAGSRARRWRRLCGGREGEWSRAGAVPESGAGAGLSLRSAGHRRRGRGPCEDPGQPCFSHHLLGVCRKGGAPGREDGEESALTLQLAAGGVPGRALGVLARLAR